jgi:phosphatidylinositol alpha-1,6-mannosyltransferase
MSLAEQYKGHDMVIRAMPELLRRFPDLRYDIVGDGDARPGLQALTQELGVGDAVRFHGIVSEAELRQHYAQASLFIMPSRAEGFGFVFLEAMAHGLPVIGGNVDATPEVVVHGETGLLVNPTSVDDIVEATSRLLREDALRLRMGDAARRVVLARFSYASFQRRLVEELSETAPGTLRVSVPGQG